MRTVGRWISGAFACATLFAFGAASAQEPSPTPPVQSTAPPAEPPPPPPVPEQVPVPPQTYAPPAPTPAPTNAPQQPSWPVSNVEDAAPERAVSLTISPVHLLFPILELTLEVAASEQVGIGLVVGVGRVGVKVDGASSSFTAGEVGASLRYYAVGDFSSGGMQLGAEVLWVHVFTDSDVDGEVTSAAASGVAVGPMIGYKYVSRGGFTFDGQLGAQWMTVSSESGSESAEASGIIPLLNVNLGWSF